MAAMRNGLLPAWHAGSENDFIRKYRDSGLGLSSCFLGAFFPENA